jgi:hypothetical protein
VRLKEDFLKEWVKRLESGLYFQIFDRSFGNFDHHRDFVAVLMGGPNEIDDEMSKKLKSYYYIGVHYKGARRLLLTMACEQIFFKEIVEVLQKNQLENTFHNLPGSLQQIAAALPFKEPPIKFTVDKLFSGVKHVELFDSVKLVKLV